jgi:hypothetical protein
MELARAWLREGFAACPAEVHQILESSPLTRGTKLVEGKPEHVTAFPERGEGRNHDLWSRGFVNGNPFTLCIEAKADESFGPLIGDYVTKGREKAREEMGKTGVPKRVAALLEVLNVRGIDVEASPFRDLRYLRSASRRAGARLACFVLRRRHSGASEIGSQVPDALSVEHVAVMRAVQDVLHPVQTHAHARSGKRFHRSSQVMKERLDLAPMNVPADRLAENSANQLPVFVAHETCTGSGTIHPHHRERAV